MYAKLCKRLTEEAPNFENPNSVCTFRFLLLNKCKTEFENRSHASEAYPDDAILSPEDEERKQNAKRKMLGNIKVSLYLCYDKVEYSISKIGGFNTSHNVYKMVQQKCYNS